MTSVTGGGPAPGRRPPTRRRSRCAGSPRWACVGRGGGAVRSGGQAERRGGGRPGRNRRGRGGRRNVRGTGSSGGAPAGAGRGRSRRRPGRVVRRTGPGRSAGRRPDAVAADAPRSSRGARSASVPAAADPSAWPRPTQCRRTRPCSDDVCRSGMRMSLPLDIARSSTRAGAPVTSRGPSRARCARWRRRAAPAPASPGTWLPCTSTSYWSSRPNRTRSPTFTVRTCCPTPKTSPQMRRLATSAVAGMTMPALLRRSPVPSVTRIMTRSCSIWIWSFGSCTSARCYGPPARRRRRPPRPPGVGTKITPRGWQVGGPTAPRG